MLADHLREPADVRLIVSSTQVLPEGHGWERWGNFPRECQRLYDLIRDMAAKGVVFPSGDRHIGGLYRETTGTPYPLIEITSSGINQVFAASRERGPNRLGGVYGAANFGTADIDRWQGTLTLSLRNEPGEPVRRHSVRLDVDARAERQMGHIGAGEWKGREATVHVIDPKLLRALIRMSKHYPATFMRLSFDEITNQGEWGFGMCKDVMMLKGGRILGNFENRTKNILPWQWLARPDLDPLSLPTNYLHHICRSTL